VKRAILAALAGVAALGVFVAFLFVRAPSAAPAAPDFILPDLSGKTVRLRDFRGKVVVLNLWATWCTPCVAEMPTLETLWKRMAGRDLVLLAVNQDERTDGVRGWVDGQELTFPVLLDPRAQVAHDYGVSGYPETFVIDRNGRVVHHHIGFRDWSEPEIVAALEHLLTTGEWVEKG
jgi:peroxiredoxin